MSLFSKWIVGGLVVGVVAGAPKHTYDAKKDRTTYSSGDIRTGGMTGMSAEYFVPGKNPGVPETINLGMGSLRVKGEQDLTDEQLAKWGQVNTVQFNFGTKTVVMPAVPGWKVSHNNFVETIYGHSLEEYVDVKFTPAQFLDIATSGGFQVVLGHKEGDGKLQEIDHRAITAGQLKPLKALYDTIPATSTGSR